MRAKRWEDGERAQRRFRQLIEDLGAELGHAHGWKRAIADRLEMNPAHLSRVLNRGTKVGPEILHRAARLIAFDPEYFQSERGTYHSFPTSVVRQPSIPGPVARPLEADEVPATARRIRTSYRRSGSINEVDAVRLASTLLALAPVAAALDWVASTDERERAAKAYVMASTLAHLRLLTDELPDEDT